jgi:hypothetical protein
VAPEHRSTTSRPGAILDDVAGLTLARIFEAMAIPLLAAPPLWLLPLPFQLVFEAGDVVTDDLAAPSIGGHFIPGGSRGRHFIWSNHECSWLAAPPQRIADQGSFG